MSSKKDDKRGGAAQLIQINGVRALAVAPSKEVAVRYYKLYPLLASVILMSAHSASLMPSLRAQAPVSQALDASTPAAGESKPQLPIVPSDVAGIEIAFGRLRLTPDRYRIVRRQETFAENSGWRTLQVSVVDSRPALRASFADQFERWTVQLDSTIGAEWSREISAQGRTIKIDYSQKPQQSIVIVVSGAESKAIRMSGDTLWHLTEQNPHGFSSYVLPALKRLNHNWNLPGTLATAKTARSANGLDDDHFDPSMLLQCVEELESTDRIVRAAAAERLRSAGVSAQIPLFELTHRQLTMQQRKTIEQLLVALEPRSADTPTRLAYWLSGCTDWH